MPLISYKTDVFDRHNFTTLALASEPTVSASNLSFRNIGSNSTVVKWTNGNGAKKGLVAGPSGGGGGGGAKQLVGVPANVNTVLGTETSSEERIYGRDRTWFLPYGKEDEMISR